MKAHELQIPEPGQKLSLPSDLDDLMHELNQLSNKKLDLDAALFKAVHATRFDMDGVDASEKLNKVAQLRQQLEDVAARTSQLEQEIAEKQPDIVHSDTTKNLLNFVETHCASCLRSVQQAKKYLYRGTKSYAQGAFIGNSLKDRQPKDSHPVWSAQFDYLLELNHIQALRSNSIFCTSIKAHAATFGELFFIFPIDGHHHFSYTVREDLVLTKHHAESWADDQAVLKLKAQLQDVEKNPLVPEPIKRAAASYRNYTWANLFTAIPQMPYTQLNDVTEYVPDINLDWRAYVSVEAFNSAYEPSQTDLALALLGGKEVLVNGAYVALQYKTYARVMEDHWKIPIL